MALPQRAPQSAPQDGIRRLKLKGTRWAAAAVVTAGPRAGRPARHELVLIRPSGARLQFPCTSEVDAILTLSKLDRR